MGLDRVPVKKSDVRLNQLKQGTVLFNPRTEEVHLLNPAALLVWECCTGVYTMNDIARMLGAVYGIDDLSSEVQAIIEQFSVKFMLEIVYRQ